MRRGLFRRIVCTLFGCDLQLVEPWSSPPRRLVFCCSRCLFIAKITPTTEIVDLMVQEQTNKLARNYQPWLN